MLVQQGNRYPMPSMFNPDVSGGLGVCEACSAGTAGSFFFVGLFAVLGGILIGRYVLPAERR